MILHRGLGDEPLNLRAEVSTNPLSRVAPPELREYAKKVATDITSMTVGMVDEYRAPLLKAALDAVYPGMHEMAVAEAKANPALQKVIETKFDAFGVKTVAEAMVENYYVSTRDGIASAIEHYVMREILEKGKAAREAQGLGSAAAAARAENAAPTSTWIAPPMPVDGECSSDGGFIWRGDHWERIRAGERCAFIGTYSGTEATGPAGGVQADGKVVAVTPEEMVAAKKAFQVGVGPFYIPTYPERSSGRITWNRGVAFPDDWAKKIADLLGKDQVIRATGRGTEMFARESTTRGTRLAPLRDFIPGLPDSISLACISLMDPRSVDDDKAFYTHRPIMQVKHPKKPDEDWGLFMHLLSDGSAPYLVFQWRKVPEPSWFGKALAAFFGAIFDFITQVASWIKDGACALFGSRIGVAVGSAIGTGAAAYLGVDPKKGAVIGGAGAALIGKACQANPPPAPAPPPPPPPSSPLVPVLIGGAALLGVFLLTRKPKPL